MENKMWRSSTNSKSVDSVVTELEAAGYTIYKIGAAYAALKHGEFIVVHGTANDSSVTPDSIPVIGMMSVPDGVSIEDQIVTSLVYWNASVCLDAINKSTSLVREETSPGDRNYFVLENDEVTLKFSMLTIDSILKAKYYVVQHHIPENPPVFTFTLKRPI